MLFPFQEVGKSRETYEMSRRKKFQLILSPVICFSRVFVRLGKVWGRKGMTAEVYFTSPLCYLLSKLLMPCTRAEFLHRLRGISSFLSTYFILPDVNGERRVIVNHCMHSLNVPADLG